MRLESLYSRVSATGTLSDETQSADPGAKPGVVLSTRSQKLTIQASGDLKKVEQDLILAKRRDPSTGLLRDLPISPADPARSITCRGRNYSFQLRWEKDTPILTSYGTPGDEDNNKILTRSIDDLLRAPCGVLVWGGLHMTRILSFPSFSITDVAKRPGRSGDNLLIEFTFDVRDNPAYPAAAMTRIEKSGKRVIYVKKRWIETSPSEGWTIQACGHNRSLGRLDFRQEIEYGETLRRDSDSEPRSRPRPPDGENNGAGDRENRFWPDPREPVHRFGLRPSGTRRPAPGEAREPTRLHADLRCNCCFFPCPRVEIFCEASRKARLVPVNVDDEWPRGVSRQRVCEGREWGVGREEWPTVAPHHE